MTTVKIFSLY